MNNIVIGGWDPPFVYYETIGGGMGACPHSHGESAIHSHMTNTMNTPIEALEFSYPLMVTAYRIRENSGGKGRFSGGDGIVREIELLRPAQVTVISQRRRPGPYGLEGGKPGACGRNTIIIGNKEKDMPPIFSERLPQGAKIRIETPGGGGFGAD